LGRYLEIQPDRIQFGYGKNGKPFLSERGKGLEFNLAHSDEMALVAVTASGQLGVDVERVRVLEDLERPAMTTP